MKRSAYRWLAAASLVAAICPAFAASRPRYGGTLRLEVSAPVYSLDPVQSGVASSTREHLAFLIFDRLTRLDRDGSPRPQLAISWQHDPDHRRWQFRLRPGVVMHNGSPLRANLVATSLSTANPTWRVRVGDEDLIIESDAPMPNLPTELARARNSIAGQADDGAPIGTGRFRVNTWEQGKRVVLAANEDYWGGRPYLDSIELLMGRSQREQAVDLRLGRADVIEIPPQRVRAAAQEGLRVVSSAPAELIALIFGERPSAQNIEMREAISLAIDRSSIQNTLLQKQGEAAGSLLPQWVSGYSFLFPVSGGLERARQLSRMLGPNPALTLAYDWNDPLTRAVAERAAVNARDAGISVQAFGENLAARSPNADAQIVRIPLPSQDPAAALAGLAAALGKQESLRLGSGSPEEVYAADRALRQDFRFVPIVYVPEGWGLSTGVKNWITPRAGGWPLADVWLEGAQP